MSFILKRLIFRNRITGFIKESLHSIVLYRNEYPFRCKYTLSLGNFKLSSINKNFLCIKTYSNAEIRFKSDKSRQSDSDAEQTDDDKDEDNDISEFLEGNRSDGNITQLTLPSLRLDAVISSGLGISRNKVGKMFYESRIRANGKKILKKCISVSRIAEIDIIKGFSPDNSDFLIVGRIEILSKKFNDKNGRFILTIRRDKNLVIENYPDASEYKPQDAVLK